MKKFIFVLVLFVGVSVSVNVSSAYAASVRISPLEYKTQLEKGEKKKGSVDVTNPSSEIVDLKLYVEGFSQIDNKGNLTFFDSEQIAAGLLLDYDSVTLSAHQTLRLFFLVDGTKLPSGDVFAVIFAQTIPAASMGTNTAARVGTLVMLTNGTPGPRHAEISQLDVASLQLSDALRGQVTVKNPAPMNTATGFFPDMTVELSPWGGTSKFQGPLIFAGRSRTAEFAIPSDQFGLYNLKIRANDSEKTTLVFLITGYWRILAPILAMVVIGIGVLLIKFRPWEKQRLRRYRQGVKSFYHRGHKRIIKQ